MLRLFALLILILITQTGYSISGEVKHKVDSLKKIISTTKSDTVRIKSLKEWDDLIYYDDPETDLKLNLQMAEECEKGMVASGKSEKEKKFFQRSAASAYNNLGSIFQFRGEMKKSLSYMEKSLKLYKKLNFLPGLSNVYGNLGISYSVMGDQKNAITYMTKALKVQEKLKDELSIAATYNNLAVLYTEQNMLEEAIDYYEKALEIRIRLKDDKTIAAAYANLASAYFDLQQDDKSFEYLKKAEEIELRIDDPTGMAQVYHNLGSYYNRKKKFETAIAYFNDAVKLRTQVSDKRGLASTHANLANSYYQIGKYNEAEKSALLALEIAKSADAVDMMMESSKQLKNIYSKKNDFKNAFAMGELYAKMKDSVANEDTRKMAMRQNIEYEFHRQKISDSVEFAKQEQLHKLQIDKQKAEALQKDIELENEQLMRYGLFLVLILVLVFSYFLFTRFKVIRQQKLIIEERNRDIVDSINYAERIQRSILPTRNKFKETFDDYFILYMPKDVVSGDFYWLETVHTTVQTELRDKVSVFAAVDCTGHGVPGALMSVVGNTLLNQTIKNPNVNSPAEALDFLNRELPKNLKKQNTDDVVRDGMDISMCAIDRKAGKLYFAGANNPIYIIKNNELIEYKGDKQSISGADDIPKTNFTNHVIPIETGDAIYLFSDGYADQFGNDEGKEKKSGGKKFKYKRLKEILLSVYQKPMQEQENKLKEVITAWRGEMEQTDDILVIGIRV